MIMKKLILSFMILSTLLISCGKDSGTDDPNNPNGNGGEQTTLTISPNELTFKSEGEEKTFSITSNSDWIITNPSTWCKINPTQGNGNSTITAIADPSEEYDDRNFNLTIKAGETTKVMTVTQKKKDAIILTKEKYDIPTEGDNIAVEVKSNISYSTIIPDEHKEWIKQVETKQLGRGLETKNLNFEISANPTTDKREGSIVIKDNSSSLADTIHVYQAQKDELILTQDTYNVSSEGENINVELRSNVDYEVIIPEDVKDWVTRITGRSSRVDNLIFNIAANPTYDNRSAKVIIKDKNSELSDTLNISQPPKNTYIGNIVLSNDNDLIKLKNNGSEIITGNLTIDGDQIKTLALLDNIITQINGDLRINCSTLTTFDGLYGLTKITGNLIVERTSYTTYITMEGLNNLTTIGGDFKIIDYARIKNINELEKLTSIGGNFIISCNIESLEGLKNLTSIGENFEILGRVDDLNSFYGLNKLNRIGGNFKLALTANSNLNSFQHLENLQTIGGDFDLSEEMHDFTSFEGLNNLQVIGGSFKLGHLYKLQTFKGLDKLIKIEQNFEINATNSLNSIVSFEGLNNLTSIGGDFKINARAKNATDSEDYYSLNALESFKGLEKLTSIGGNFIINAYSSYFSSWSPQWYSSYALNSLNSFEGLGNLTSIAGNFEITCSSASSASLTKLESLKGLDKLNYIGGYFKICGVNRRELHALTSLEGLNSALSINDLILDNCSELVNIDKLVHITKTTNISITKCPKLYDFCVLKNVVKNNNCDFYTEGNGYNPTKYQLLNGECSKLPETTK